MYYKDFVNFCRVSPVNVGFVLMKISIERCIDGNEFSQDPHQFI